MLPDVGVVACVIQGNQAFWAHCGDSRLYLVRGAKLVARTRDHSYSELQETLSQVVPMGDRVNRNVLFTCLGSPGKPVVDTAGPLALHSGDRMMLCSDGLWSSLPDNVITEVLARHPIHEAVPELVERALRVGWRLDGWHTGVYLRVTGAAPPRTALSASVEQALRRHGVSGAFAERADGNQAYRNRRAEMYARLRQRLDPGASDSVFAIPPTAHDLRRELSILPLQYDSEGKLVLPPKDAPAESE